jgi:hypothetical protein
MTDINLKTETPDTTLPTTGFLFGADSQAAASPSVFTVQSVATTLLGSTTLSGATITADAPVLNMSQTWNDAAVTFTGLKANVTDTASAAASLLMDLQVGGASKFSVSKAGLVLVPAATNTVSYAIGLTNTGFSAGGGGGGIDTFLNGFRAFRQSATLFRISANVQVGWASTADVSAAAEDTILTRRGTANLRFGAADAAAPVAQTLSVQSVVAGTSNTAGAALTITGSQGTGSGAAGTIVFQTASAGSSGTSQNALATVATIGPSTLSGSQAISLLDLSQTWNTSGTPTGLKFNVTDTASPSASLMMDLQVGGTSRFYVRKDGQVITQGGFGGQGPITTSSYMQADSATGIWLRNAGATVTFGNPGDIHLSRDAANTLAQRNAANAQAFRLYNTWTSFGSGTEIWERANFFWDSNVLKIGTAKGANGGTARALELQTDGTTRLTIAATTGNVTTTGSVTTEAPTGGTAAAWRLGTVASVSPTSPNRTIEVDIGGTIYYISAKTTND